MCEVYGTGKENHDNRIGSKLICKNMSNLKFEGYIHYNYVFMDLMDQTHQRRMVESWVVEQRGVIEG